MTRTHRGHGSRRSPTTALIGLLAAVLMFSACQGRTGTIDSRESPSASTATAAPAESATTPAASGYAADLPDGVCPGLETFPVEHLGPVDYTVDEVIEPGTDGAATELRCVYEPAEQDQEAVATSEGILTAGVSVTVYEPDTTPPEFAAPDPIDFGAYPAASYFKDWDQSTLDFEIEHREVHFTNHANLSVTASTDNITVYAGVVLFFTGDDADAEAATFAMVEDLAAAALEALPRT